MTAKKFLLFLILQWVIFTFVKVWLFNTQVFASATLQNWFFWAIIAFVSVIFVRRFGIISYFECIFLLIMWVVVDLFLDLLITSSYTGLGIFKVSEYWFGYLAMILAVMIFHKKRHIAVRKELHAKHHGHGGHHH